MSKDWKLKNIGINLSSPNQIIILTQNGEFKLKTTKKAISDYGVGLLAMHVQIIPAKLGGRVVNDNIPLKVKEGKKKTKKKEAKIGVLTPNNPT